MEDRVEGGKETKPWEVDPHALDREWLKQARLSRDTGTDEADCKHALNKASARLKLKAAQLRADIRRNPESYGFGAKKPSIDEVDDAMTSHEAYQTAVAEEIEAQLAFDRAKAITVAVSHDRRKTLENLVELLRLDYFSEKDHDTSVGRAREGVDRTLLRERSGGVEYDPYG